MPPPDNETLSEYRWQFHGSAGEYFRIWLVNILLSVLTFGIFSAWAKVRNKRYFYGNTTLNGFSFDYHASPVSILVSRLIVIAFVAGSAIVAGDYAPAIAIQTAVIYFLLPWALVRGFSFQARNSSYRSVRFHFDRAYSRIYRLLAPGLILLLAGYLIFVFAPPASLQGSVGFLLIGVYLALFFFVPVSLRAYYRFKTVHHAWGDISFGYAAPPLMKFIAPLLVVVLTTWLAGSAVLLLGLNLLTFVPLAAALLSLLWLAACLFRLYWQSVRVAGGTIQCDFSTATFCFSILLVNLLATVLSLGLLHPWAKVRKVRFLTNHIRLLVPADAMDSAVKRQQERESALGAEFDSAEGFDFDVGLI